RGRGGVKSSSLRPWLANRSVAAAVLRPVAWSTRSAAVTFSSEAAHGSAGAAMAPGSGPGERASRVRWLGELMLADYGLIAWGRYGRRSPTCRLPFWRRRRGTRPGSPEAGGGRLHGG